jgi:hypothetical protein
MFNLFLILLGLGVSCIVLSAFLYVKWDIADAVDELSGKKRLRQIEKLKKASMAIGATSVVASTTQMFRDSEEDEELASIIQNAHNVEETPVQGIIPTVDINTSNLEAEKTSFIPEEEIDDSMSEGVEVGTVSATRKVVFLEELSNMEV